MNYKSGDIVYIGGAVSSEPTLKCSILRINKSGFTASFRVINGAWDGFLDLKGMTAKCNHTKEVFPIKIFENGHIEGY